MNGINNRALEDYIKTPLSSESLDLLYSANKVRIENVILYSDFSQSLIDLIFETYLGDDEIKMSNEDNYNHFTWCWDKTINNFKKEGIDFTKNNKLKSHYFDFIDLTYYQHKNKNTRLISNNKKVWVEIFDTTIIKTRSEVDTFLSFYELFSKSI